MSSLRERNRRRTREDIAATALDLFERQGYASTTVEQITAASGVSSATFFRYFATKEDVLFADEDTAAEALVERVADRGDRAQTLSAMAPPFAAYADTVDDGSGSRLTRLVMTTPALAPRSLRMRLRWENALAGQLAAEQDAPSPALGQTVLAALSVSCLTSALRYWTPDGSPSLASLVRSAFALAGDRRAPS